jgi:hypothetical protein
MSQQWSTDLPDDSPCPVPQPAPTLALRTE